MKMRAARMHGYKQPLRLETIPVPDPGRDEVRLKVGAAGMCRTDFQLIDGYFKEWGAHSEFPLTPGHEIAGWVDAIGSDVPKSAGLKEGDLVVVSGAVGDGVCRQCHDGNEHICAGGHWIGFGAHGGYAEYVPVHHKTLVKIPQASGLSPEQLAPLTDAGLTTYRGVKKLVAAGALGPGRVVAVMGAGGLGLYAVQYLKLLGGGATVVAFGRNDEKLASSKVNGADHVINIRNRSVADVRQQLDALTGRSQLDAVIDCVGADETIQLGFSLLAVQGAYTSVGLVGTRANLPLFPLVAREYSYFGSFWGNYNDLVEVMALAQAGSIHHSVARVQWESVNESINALGRGEFVGRAVIVYD